MEQSIILNNRVQFVKHPVEEGVYVKHISSTVDKDLFNSIEVRIEPGCKISPHIHDTYSEFYYALNGEGEFLNNGKWELFKKGDALKVPFGMEHGLKNTGKDSFVIFSTFSLTHK